MFDYHSSGIAWLRNRRKADEQTMVAKAPCAALAALGGWALFGPQGFGQRQGWIMAPSRLAQALAPLLFGACVARWGAGAMWVSTALGLSAPASLRSAAWAEGLVEVREGSTPKLGDSVPFIPFSELLG